MFQKRFLTPDEIHDLSTMARVPKAKLEDLLTIDHIPISSTTKKIAENIGPIAEEELGFGVEFLSSIYTLNDPEDPSEFRTVSDIFLPVQDNSGPTYFEPSLRMLEQMNAFLEEKRLINPHWDEIGTAHGHGRAKVIGHDELVFSNPDVERHMDHFIKSHYIYTQKIIGSTTEIPIVSNDFQTYKSESGLIIFDENAHNPFLKFKSLDQKQQSDVLVGLGINPDALNGNDPLDIFDAYINYSKQVAQKENQFAISGQQCQIMGYNYFLVFDNEKENVANIGLLLRSTVTNDINIHIAELPLKEVEVKDDIPYNENTLRETVRTAFDHLIVKQSHVVPENIKKTTLPRKEYDNSLVRIEKNYETQFVPKDKIIDVFFRSALNYLEFSDLGGYRYSQALSDIMNSFGPDYDGKSTFIDVANERQEYALHDDTVVYLNPNLEEIGDVVKSNISKALENSKTAEVEMNLMMDFSLAGNAIGQNKVLDQYMVAFKNYKPGGEK